MEYDIDNCIWRKKNESKCKREKWKRLSRLEREKTVFFDVEWNGRTVNLLDFFTEICQIDFRRHDFLLFPLLLMRFRKIQTLKNICIWCACTWICLCRLFGIFVVCLKRRKTSSHPTDENNGDQPFLALQTLNTTECHLTKCLCMCKRTLTLYSQWQNVHVSPLK